MLHSILSVFYFSFYLCLFNEFEMSGLCSSAWLVFAFSSIHLSNLTVYLSLNNLPFTLPHYFSLPHCHYFTHPFTHLPYLNFPPLLLYTISSPHKRSTILHPTPLPQCLHLIFYPNPSPQPLCSTYRSTYSISLRYT